MTYEKWHILYDLLSLKSFEFTDHNEVLLDKKHIDNLDDFISYSYQVLHNFMEECRANEASVEDKNLAADTFGDLSQKLIWLKKDLFSEVQHGDEVSLLFIPQNFEIPPADKADKSGKVFVLIRIYDLFLRVLAYLTDRYDRIKAELEDKKQAAPKINQALEKKTRSTALPTEFRLKLREKDFIDFFDTLVKKKYLDSKTPRNDFIYAFTGRKIAEKLTWMDDQYSLTLLVKELEKKGCFGRKLNDGKWEIVANLFKPVDKPYYEPSKLAHTSPTKKKDYSPLVYIAEEVAEMMGISPK